MDGRITPLNLVKQVNPESSKLKPGFYKQIILDLLTVGSAVLFGYAYRNYLDGRASFGELIGTIAVFFIFSVLQLFFSKNLWRRFLVMVLEAAGIIFFFWGYDLKVLGATAAIIIGFNFWGEFSGSQELENNLSVRFFKSAKPLLAKLTTAIILLLILLYTPQWKPENIFVSEKTFQGFNDWLSAFINNFYPDINLNSSFLEFSRGLAKSQLQGNNLFSALPASERDKQLNEAARQISEGISKNFNIEVNSNDPMGKVIYKFIVASLKNLLNRFGNLFLAVWGLTIFFAVRGIGTIFYWLVGILTFIIYQILLASNFVHIVGETRTHEVIEW